MWAFWIFPFCVGVVAGQDYVDECPEANGFFADAVQCDRYYECKNGQVNLCDDKRIVCTVPRQVLKWQKMLKGFQDCHENALMYSFEMSPHLICLG